jgi:hypothetical protein
LAADVARSARKFDVSGAWVEALGSPILLLDDVSAAVPVGVHVLAATPPSLDHELLGIAQALVEVELDLVRADAAI